MTALAAEGNPSLFAAPSSSVVGSTPDAAAPSQRTLPDLMADGFYLLLLIRRGQLPQDEAPFLEAVERFLDGLERSAQKLGTAGEDVFAAKYAFCAAVDEAILSTPSPLRERWECRPLQLAMFGDHLAGEHFFSRLEALRAQGAPRLQALEVYYFCLLLGFEAKYRIEGAEKLGYLTARLGDEITYLKGARAQFAPHWAPPDAVAHALRRVVPVWAPAAAVAVIGAMGFIGLASTLDSATRADLAGYQDVVRMPARTAHVTITLP